MSEDGFLPWWPTNPYPEHIFPMTDKGVIEVLPDGHIRTAVAGNLMRRGWNKASEDIYAALVEHLKQREYPEMNEREQTHHWPGISEEQRTRLRELATTSYPLCFHDSRTRVFAAVLLRIIRWIDDQMEA